VLSIYTLQIFCKCFYKRARERERERERDDVYCMYVHVCACPHSLPFDKMLKEIEWHFETLTSKGEMREVCLVLTLKSPQKKKRKKEKDKRKKRKNKTCK
jgi:hypothetical protein